MREWQEGKVADHVTFSPAERAVLVEQLETLRLDIDAMVVDLKHQDSKTVLNSWIACQHPWDYVKGLISRKVSTAMFKIVQEDE